MIWRNVVALDKLDFTPKKINDNACMKKTLFILLGLVSFVATKAQDRIITVLQDTIECRILSVGAERISYEQKNAENYLVGKSIPISEVLEYFRAEQNPGVNELYLRRPPRQKPEHRYLFTLQGGLSSLTNDFSDFKTSMTYSGVSGSDADDYISDLKSGYYAEVALHYLLTRGIAVGIDYSFFTSSADMDLLGSGYIGYNVPAFLNQKLEEKFYAHFIGPSVLFAQFPDLNKKIRITETVSPGIMLFREESRGNSYEIYWGDNGYYEGAPPQYIEQSNSLTTGKAYGARGALSVEYCFTPQLSAGLAGSFTWAKMHKASFKMADYEVDEQKLEDPLDLSRFDYGFTIRYNF